MNKGIFENPNGFQTNVWGPGAWLFLHCITLNYIPVFKKEYYTFFKVIEHVLPCKGCRDNYSYSINKSKSLKLTYGTLKNRDTLSRWLFNLHNYVRCKTKNRMTYTNNDGGYKTMLEFYERFRAKCSLNKTHTKCSKSYYKGMRLRSRILILPFCDYKTKSSIIMKTVRRK